MITPKLLAETFNTNCLTESNKTFWELLNKIIYHYLRVNLEATTKLSRAALEALAIVAYKQPVTRPAIDAIRGVNSDGVIRSLLNKGLLEEAGRAETPGRPILYQTTLDFLCHFGLSSLDELPPLEPSEAVKTNHILKD